MKYELNRSYNGGGVVYVLKIELSGSKGQYCKDDLYSTFSSLYVNMIGLFAKNCHSFKFVQNRSKIFW